MKVKKCKITPFSQNKTHMQHITDQTLYREYRPKKGMEMIDKCDSVPKYKTTSTAEGKVRP